MSDTPALPDAKTFSVVESNGNYELTVARADESLAFALADRCKQSSAAFTNNKPARTLSAVTRDRDTAADLADFLIKAGYAATGGLPLA